MAREITTDDINHLPHLVIVKRAGESRWDVIEHENGESAHASVYDFMHQDVERVIVCARIRTLGRF